MPCRRLFLACLSVAAAAAAGCGGGGGSGGGPPAPSPTPFVVDARPLAAGDTFAFSGTATKTDTYFGAVPSPQATFAYTVSQKVAVSGPAVVPAAFGGSASAYDFRTAETDTSPLQQIGITTDTYYAMSGADLLTYGSSSTDTNGETVTIAYASVGTGNGLVDVLPERAGQTWSNTNAQTLTETAPAQQTATRTYAADGSYADTASYVATGITTAINETADGAGSYLFSQGGAPIYSITMSAPQTGTAGSVVVVQQTVPNPAGTPTVTTQNVAVWYPQPVALYTETDQNKGIVTIPPACGTTANAGIVANELVRATQQVDTVLGTVERITQRDYVVPTFGVACVQLSDDLTFYYDYSGQSAAFPSFASTRVETQTMSSTLGLTGAVTSAGTAVRRDAAGRGAGLRLANARAAFFTAVEREKQVRRRAVVAHILKALARGVRP